MRITRLSRASWFKIQTEDQIIHFDPGYTGYFKSQGIPEKELQDKADLILISHFHKDHCQPEAVSMIRSKKTKIYAPLSCVDRLKNIITVSPEKDYQIGQISFKTVDAYNTPDSHSTRKVHHKGDGVGYIITIDGKIIYHAGDTDFIPEMKEFGRIDIAFLPIGGTFVMDIEEAVKAVKIINPKIVIPMHESKQKLEDVERQMSSKITSTTKLLKVGETCQI